jgi:hypothetical protein
MSRGGTQDPLVVRSEDLADLLLPYMHEQEAMYERNRGNSWGKSDDILSGTAWVAERVGINLKGIHRTLFNQDWVGYGKANDWLTLCGLPELASELRPVANPMWSRERWEEWARGNGWPCL